MMKNIISRLIKSDNFHSILGNAAFALFGFTTFLIMVRVVDKALFGQWVLFVTMASLLDMFRLGLTGTASIRLISRAVKYESKIIGASAYSLSLFTTLLLAIVFLTAYYFLNNIFSQSYYLPVLLYYPFLALASLAHYQASILAQGEVNFKRVMILKIINGLLILLFVSGYIIFWQATLQGLISVYIVANLLASVVVILVGWDGIRFIGSANRTIIKSILQFGKYSTASSVGSSLLRSSDTIILSMAPFLGVEAIAIYAIPLKFVEVVEIPLRSFTATAFPKLSKSLIKTNEGFKKMLFNYTFWSTVVLFPVVAVLILFPKFFLQLIGGPEYFDSLHTQQAILYVICIYILLLPLDRYSGVALFAIDKPKLNFYKIMLMLVANLVFDYLAVFVFNSLIYVALATLIFTLIGVFIGWYMLSHEMNTQLKNYPDFIMNRMNNYLYLMKQTCNF